METATRSWVSGRRIDELLERNRARYLQTRPEGTGWLADAPAAINDQIEWSEVYTPSRRRPYLTVSRAWAHANNSAPDFLWDSFFNALLASQEDRGRSFNMLRDITSWQNDQGMFAQYGEWRPQMTPGIFPVAWGHTQYPLGALATAKVCLRWPDRRFMAEIYPRQDYWRGKVWSPVNYLVYQGLKINEWDHEAHLLAASSARMFFKPWREKAECRENFLATTGEGSSDPHYTWGALMALIAVEELVDANPWHGLRFGNLEPSEPAGIARYPVAGALYDVQLSAQGLAVRREGKPLFAATTPVEIRKVEFHGARVRCEVRANRPGQLRIGVGRAVPYASGLTRLTERFE